MKRKILVLVQSVWTMFIYELLAKQCEKTETLIDDKILEIVNDVILQLGEEDL